MKKNQNLSESSNLQSQSNQTFYRNSINLNEENEFQDQITLENFNTFFDFALNQKNENLIEESLMTFKALSIKGAQIYNSDININLALVYFQIGHIMLEQLEQSPNQDTSSSNNTNSQGEIDSEIQSSQLSKSYNSSKKNQKKVKNYAPNQDQVPVQDYTPNRDQSPVQDYMSNQDQVPVLDYMSNKDQVPVHNNKSNRDQSVSDEETQKEHIEALQVAWENLEFCRLCLSQYLNEQRNLNPVDREMFQSHLSNCHLRMGDCESFRDEWEGALEEYSTALGIILELTGNGNQRRAAELYFLIGNTWFYQGRYNEALGNYEKGKTIIGELLEELKSVEKFEEGELVTEFGFIKQSFEERIKKAETMKVRVSEAKKRDRSKNQKKQNKGSSSFENSELGKIEGKSRDWDYFVEGSKQTNSQNFDNVGTKKIKGKEQSVQMQGFVQIERELGNGAKMQDIFLKATPVKRIKTDQSKKEQKNFFEENKD